MSSQSRSSPSYATTPNAKEKPEQRSHVGDGEDKEITRKKETIRRQPSPGRTPSTPPRISSYTTSRRQSFSPPKSPTPNGESRKRTPRPNPPSLHRVQASSRHETTYRQAPTAPAAQAPPPASSYAAHRDANPTEKTAYVRCIDHPGLVRAATRLFRLISAKTPLANGVDANTRRLVRLITHRNNTRGIEAKKIDSPEDLEEALELLADHLCNNFTQPKPVPAIFEGPATREEFSRMLGALLKNVEDEADNRVDWLARRLRDDKVQIMSELKGQGRTLDEVWRRFSS